MIYRSMTFADASTTVHTTKTRDLTAGWFLYSTATTPGTKIASITDDTHFVLDAPAVATVSVQGEATYACPGVRQERNDALMDVAAICRERGQEIALHIADEQDVDRGRYGGIEKRGAGTLLTVYAFPVEYAPSVRRLEKAGLREEAAAVCYLPAWAFMQAGIEFDNLTITGNEGIDVRRSWAVIGNEKFEVKEKAKVSVFSDAFAYYTLGLQKR